MLSLLILLAMPQQAKLGPVTAMRYRYQSNTETHIDMASLMAGMKNMPGMDSSSLAAMAKSMPADLIPPVRNMVLMTVQARDSAGGRAAHIIIDSVTSTQFAAMEKMLGKMDSLPGTIPDSLKKMLKDASKSAKGETLDVFAFPGRQLVVTMSVTGNAQAEIVHQALQMLFPPMKLGTKVGQIWTDTVSTDTLISASGMDIAPKSTVVTEWKMLSDVLFEGNVTTTVAMSMGGDQSGGGLGAVLGDLSGEQKGKTRLQLDKNRWVVQALSSTTMTMNMKMPMLGDSPMHMSQAASISLNRIP